MHWLVAVTLLFKSQREGTRSGVVLGRVFDSWSAGCAIPQAKLTQINIIGIRHGSKEIITRNTASIMALKIKIHTLPESSFSKKCIVHADNFRTLGVHRGSIEILHRNITIWTNRMGHGRAILPELSCAESSDGPNSLDGVGVHVAAEFLVAKDGQTLFQCELEPIAAGDPVPGPVVEILVSNDRFYAFKILIRSCLFVG
mmetsp:Transcript_22889/g.49511  ORF Transcript_22889/g.49511 Transcript_22889/m.49511 type:complete len:200 (+) Transcript_22889:1268-1867(+)